MTRPCCLRVRWQFLGLAAAAVLLANCSPKARDEVDFGSVRNSVYSNHYFGLTLPIPKGWSVQDQSTQQRLTRAGVNAIAGDDRNLKQLLKASELQSINLLAAFKYPLGTPVGYNPAIMMVAERVRDFPGVQRGSDYLAHARRLLESGQMQVDFPPAPPGQRLGGLDFDAMKIDLKVQGITVKETYYAALRKGYAISIVLAYTTEEEEQALEQALARIQFEPDGTKATGADKPN